MTADLPPTLGNPDIFTFKCTNRKGPAWETSSLMQDVFLQSANKTQRHENCISGTFFFIENNEVRGPAQAMLPALEAILGQRSAHSLATGPVMAEPEGTGEQRGAE